MPDVTVLSKPGCVQCNATCRSLDSANVEYAHIDLSQYPDALDWALDHGYQQAPIVIVGDMSSEDFTAWTGFRPDKITSLSASMNT